MDDLQLESYGDSPLDFWLAFPPMLLNIGDDEFPGSGQGKVICRQILRDISGIDLGFDATRWVAWIEDNEEAFWKGSERITEEYLSEIGYYAFMQARDRDLDAMGR